ncbi:MAG: S8 family serine peptidase [Candidatus Eisenbacteria bacterium]|nr:S8 family serine peptidase [Candidatus Eisenbacteria bacterium]
MRRSFPFLALPLVLALSLIAVPRASAMAEIADGFEQHLQSLDDDALVSVICTMQEQAPIAELNETLKQERARLSVRHERVVRALQEVVVTQDDLLAFLADEQATGQVVGYTGYWISNLVVVQATKALIYEIAARDDVAYIEPNFSIELIEPIVDPAADDESLRGIGVTPGLRAINADRVWYELGITGAGTIVANCDTGVDGNHPALSDRWRGNFAPADECWLDVLGGHPTFPYDGYGHGTHVMGTECGLGAATQDTVGVAWNALWIACNAIDQGVGPEFDNDVIACYQWLADPDGDPGTHDDVPDVVQNSWRINENFGYDYEDCDSRWWDCIDNCEASGVVTTWSAGNEGPGAETIGSPADRITTPWNTYSVGAVDATNYDYPYPIAGFSSRGPSGCDGVTIKPEVAAPGVDVYSCVPGGGYSGSYSGTSMAGPHVAGVVGLMREANPDLDVDTIKEIISQTAHDFGSTGEDNTYGWGFLDAYEAVLAVMTGYGNLTGTITNGSNGGTPVAGVMIDVVELDRQTTSQGDGTYAISIPAGTYTVSASHPSFEPQTVTGVEVSDGEETVVDFCLTDIGAPVISETTELRSTEDQVGPYVVETMIDDFSALDHATLWYRVNGSAFSPLEMTPTDAVQYAAGIPGHPHGSFVEYYLDVEDVAGNGATDPPGAPTDLYGFYVAPIVELYSDDMEAGPGGWTHGNVLPGFGDQWHRSTQRNHTAGGSYSWKCGDTGAGEYADLLDAGLVSEPVELGIDSYMHYWQWVDAESSDAHTGYAYDGGLVEISIDGGPWEQIFPEGGYTFLVREGGTPGPFPPETPFFSGRRDWHEVHFNLTAYEGNAQFRFRFGSDGAVTREGWYVDDVLVDGFEIDFSRIEEGRDVRVLFLEPADPNPFARGTTLRYRLPQSGEVLLQIFDPTGRTVRTLVSGHQAAGFYTVPWDGRDDGARLVPSGVYLTRLQAAQQKATHKIVLAR